VLVPGGASRAASESSAEVFRGASASTVDPPGMSVIREIGVKLSGAMSASPTVFREASSGEATPSV